MEKDFHRSIAALLEITVLVLFCASEGNKTAKEGSEYYFLCFDGIEHYLHLHSKKYPLFCQDVENIILSIWQFSSNITAKNTVFGKHKVNFNNWFKIVLTVRDTTNRYMPREIMSTHINHIPSVDVTQWYRFSDIFEEKLQFFSNIKTKDKLLPLLNIITKDTAGKEPGNSIIEMLEKMYNSDKRNLINSLFDVLNELATNKKTTNLTPSEIISVWNEKEHSRYLCRQAILRLVLNKVRDIRIKKDIESDQGLLYELYFLNTKNHNHIANKYARKILLFLMNRLYDGIKIKDEYISYEEIIKGVFTKRQQQNWVGGESNEVTKEFAKVLYLMGNYKLIDSFWQQLIVIKYNGATIDKNFDESNFEKKLIECYNTPGTTNSFGVKITYSGCFLAEIQPSFEFFACRNSIGGKPVSIPLILSKDYNYISDVLERVFADAVQCIRAIINDENKSFDSFAGKYEVAGHFYSSNYENGKRLSHPYRIISSHLNYLDAYRNFVLLDLESASNTPKRKTVLFAPGDAERIIGLIEWYIGYYRNLIRQLRDGDGGARDEKELDGKKLFFNLAADNEGRPCLKDSFGVPYGYEPQGY
jgi:hypothetical protein